MIICIWPPACRRQYNTSICFRSSPYDVFRLEICSSILSIIRSVSLACFFRSFTQRSSLAFSSCTKKHSYFPLIYSLYVFACICCRLKFTCCSSLVSLFLSATICSQSCCWLFSASLRSSGVCFILASVYLRVISSNFSWLDLASFSSLSLLIESNDTRLVWMQTLQRYNFKDLWWQREVFHYMYLSRHASSSSVLLSDSLASTATWMLVTNSRPSLCNFTMCCKKSRGKCPENLI